jgi:hypothetical protein
MNAPQLIKDLQHRLSSLLEDPVFAKARQDRAVQRVGSQEDAIIAHNIVVSEEILQLDASSVNNIVNDRKIYNFRKHSTISQERKGTFRK